jgi:hypothetical protein
MSRRAASVTAWTIGFVSLGITLGSLVLWVVTDGTLASLSFPDPGIAIAFPLVGALVAARRPENPVGWVMLVVGVGGALTLASGVYGYAALVSRPSLPGEDWSYWVSSWVWTAAFVPLVTILLPIFPQGTLPSRRWRIVVGAAVVALVTIMVTGALVDPIETAILPGRKVPNPLGIGWGPAAAVQSGAYMACLVLMVVCVVGLVRRYRASRGVLRLQLTWFTYAFAVALAFLILNFVASGPNRETTAGIVAGVLASVGFGFVAVGVGVAVMRYRLYDIGRVVNRTIVYALLTAVLVGVYAAIVVGIGTAIGRRSSPVLIAGATLVVAALAGPARRGIQSLIDRRFNRRKYDAERTLAEFGTRLRDEVDVEELRRLLGQTADQTLQPERVRVWIRGVDS